MNEKKSVDISNPANLELSKEIERRRVEFYEAKTAPYPRRVHWSSDLSSCARQMVYKRVKWDAMPKTTIELQERFSAGNSVEERIGKELVALGFDIVASGTSMGKNSRMERYGISARLDRVMKFNGKYVLVEIKSMHPAVWKRTNSLEDMEKDKFLRRYLRQIQIYLFGFEIEEGLFIFDDCMGHWKMLPVYLDYDYAETILKTVERANLALESWKDGKEGQLPERIEYGQECQICPFADICLGGKENQGVEIIDSEEWEEKLKRYEETKESAKDHESIRKEISKTFQGKPRSMIGNFLITSKEGERRTYEIPEEIKAQYECKEKSYRVNVQDLSKKNED